MHTFFFFLALLSFPPPKKNINPSLQDARIEGGYEAVPTRDIHMKQVGLEETWLEFLRLYVKDLVEQQYIGYNSDVKKQYYSMRDSARGGGLHFLT